LQMTSTVTGKLQSDVKIFDIIKSLFPCGSVTGAPKIQSMKIINDLEKIPREIYTGAIGYLSPDGQAVFNVAIRTIDLQLHSDNKYHASMGMGGGIVFDSQPEDEYSECLLKAQFLKNSIPEFALIETMLLGNGKIKHLNMHLRRLKTSAQYFGIPCVKAVIKNELLRYAKSLTGKIRLRLLLKSVGEIVLEHQPFIAARGAMPKISVSGFKTQSNDPFLYHKTTHRSLYDEEHKKYAAKGYFDVIFTNQKNQITEGAISNIFVQIQGRYYTPPLNCGLLGGIGRNVLMKKLKAREKILYLKDLKRADKIILTNSVRGTTEVAISV
jgi:para-aminobenzoate synthetase/4-amino-4-deoxychorismate lyase